MIIFEVVLYAIIRRLAPLPGFSLVRPVGSEQSFQLATDPGSDGALPIDINEWSFIIGHRLR
jgi:hypothetical protein